MKIALAGIAGKIGSQVALETKKRGHVVTGITRRAAQTSGELATHMRMYLPLISKPGAIGKKSQLPLVNLPAIFGSNHTSPSRDFIGGILQ